MPNKEKNSTKPSKPSPAAASRKVQQPVDNKDDNYRLKDDVVEPLSKEVNPSHIVVKDVSQIELIKETNEMQEQPKPFKKSQFPPLSETKPDPALPSTSAWTEPLSKEVLRAPMKETNKDENGNSEKVEKNMTPKENKEIIPSKDGPILKPQVESTPVNNTNLNQDTYKESTPPASPPSGRTRTITTQMTTTNRVESKFIEHEINPPKLIIREKEEEEEIQQEPLKPFKPYEFPPLPSTDTNSNNNSNVTIIPSNVIPTIPASSVWTNPLPQTITTPDPVVRTLEKEPETKNQPKEEKKRKN